MFPKKPYKLKFDSKQALLGMPADKEWALLANYSDKTLLRNHLAFEVSRRAGLAWTPRDRFVMVVLNGVELGLYQLTETVKIAPSRVGITAMAGATGPWDGGYLIEVDERHGEALHYTTTHDVDLSLKEPSPDVNTTLHPWDAYLGPELQALEDTLFAPGFAEPATGWRTRFDEESFVAWYLVNELMKNVDATFYSSCYFHRGVGGKVHMGPVWDYDLGAGNDSENPVGKPWDPAGWYVRLPDERVATKTHWYTRLFEDPGFDAAFQARWKALSPTQLHTLRAFLEESARELKHGQQRNFQLWPILGTEVWPNPAGWDQRTTYESELVWLQDWLDARIAWIDGQVP
jgi:hypothetical protein